MPKPRKNNRRSVRKRILILAEGSTEIIYFRAIKKNFQLRNKLSAARIAPFDSEKNTGKELVDVAKDLKKEGLSEKNPYEHIWIVIDKDGYTKHPETFNKANDNNIRIAFTAISFEYWFLLHFEYTTKAFNNCDQLCKYLKNHIPNYDKVIDYYEAHLNDKTNLASERAKNVREYFRNDIERGMQVYELDAYTNVDELVDLLLNLPE